jgi:xanthine dehydrogenase small subunit
MTAYFRPATLEEALAIRASREVEIIAGGTDLYPAKTTRAGWGVMAHNDVLDITAIPGLARIEDEATHWRLGCLVTWTDLVRAELPPAFDGLKAAAREIGGLQIQNRGTLVGNLCTASPAGDGIPNLIALDAEVEIAGPHGRRVMPAEHFVDSYRHTVCQPDEIVLALRVPKPAATARGQFVKLGSRRYLVISVAMAAGVIETDGRGAIVRARVVVGACSPVARRLPVLEERLVGLTLDDDLAAAVRPEDFAVLSPLDDVRATATYRLAAAETLTRDLLSNAAAPCGRRAA